MVSIIILHYNLMGPPSYMCSVIDRYVIMRPMTVVSMIFKYLFHCGLYRCIEEIGMKCLFLTFETSLHIILSLNITDLWDMTLWYSTHIPPDYQTRPITTQTTIILMFNAIRTSHTIPVHFFKPLVQLTAVDTGQYWNSINKHVNCYLFSYPSSSLNLVA